MAIKLIVYVRMYVHVNRMRSWRLLMKLSWTTNNSGCRTTKGRLSAYCNAYVWWTV